jgi:ribosomal-protein-alanine N-acetyltransferase
MIEQVELRPVRLADVDALAGLYASERAFLAPFDPIRPDEFYTAEGQRIEVEHALAQRAAGSRYRFVIEADGELVGTLGIGNVVGSVFQSGNLGYFVAQAANGCGVATRAVALAAEQAFGPLGMHRLEAGTLVDNVASQRVLEKNGFERIGLARAYLRIAGAWRDHILFQRVAE